jgi:hypothetical protein
MRNRICTAVSLLLTLFLTLSCLTACKDEETSSSTDSVAMEDLPFGATMQQSTDTSIPVEYDYRYFSEDAISALADYFYAIQTEDTTLYTQCTLDCYTDYVVEEMYQGLVGVDGLLTQQNYNFAQQTEDETCTFYSISITDCEQATDTIHDNIDNLNTMIDALSEEEDYTANHVTDEWFLTLDISLGTTGNLTTLSDQYVFLICVDGQYLICS